MTTQSSKYITSFVTATILAVSAMLLTGTAVGAPSSQKAQDFIRQATLPSWVVPLLRVPESQKTDPIVELLSETQVWVGSKTAILYNRAIQVNDQSALAGIGQYSLSYVPAYQRLLVHKVAILRKGQLIDHTGTVNIRALEREEGLERGVYGGTKTMQMLLRDVRVGDTLWVTYTVEGDNPVFGGKVNRIHAWESDAPVEHRRLVFNYPRKRPVTWSQLGDFYRDKIAPRIEEAGDTTRLTFEQRHLSPVEGEPSTPAEYLPGRILQFSEFGSWQSVGLWAESLFAAPRSSPKVAALADSLAKGGTQAERAVAALRWVQDEVRYFSVSIGENSHRPQLPEVVLRNRYGDCKDKSLLLVSLLTHMGIQAKPVLVAAFAPRLPVRVMPSPAWFDHVIVRLTVDGREFFVDPTQTGQTETLSELTPALAGGAGLVVDASSTGLIEIPADTSDVPHFELRETISAQEFDGAGSLLSKRYYRGPYAAWARRQFSSLSQPLQRKWMLELYEKQYPGVSLAEAPVAAEEAGRFVLTARYSLPKPIEYSEKTYRIAYDTRIMEDSLQIPAKLARNYPFVPAYGKYRARYRLTMEWPKALRFNNLPSGREVDSSYLHAREDYISRGNFVDYQLDYRIKEDRVPAADMTGLHETAKRLTEFASSTFRIREEQLSAPVLAGHSYRNLLLLDFWAGVAASASKVYGKKAEQIGLQDACAYAQSLFATLDALPRSVVAEASAVRALLLSKKDEPKAAECVANGLILAGDAKNAVAILEAQSLADDSPLLPELIKARWMAGDVANAAADMERHYRAKQASGKANGFDVLRLMTLLQRAGRPVPEALLARAKSNPFGPWPMPLLAMQAGALAPEQVEALAKAMPRDASDMALNDYWLQRGQLALLKGDKDAARHAFSWFTAHGIRSHEPMLLARAEAARLVEVDQEFSAAFQALNLGRTKEGIRLLEQAAARGVPAAQYELAILYRKGEAVRKDEAKAFQLFDAAAKQGYADAYNEIARSYALGLSVSQDGKLAAEWFAKGAERGDKVAMHNLATRYTWGDNVPKDPARAVALMRESAEMGFGEAQARLAGYYRLGTGVAIDFELARFWASRASAQKEPRGYFELGNLLLAGQGVDKNEANGAKLIRTAADNGFSEAQRQFGLLAAEGTGIARDKALAMKYFRMAAEGGDADAMYDLGMALIESSNGDPNKFSEAVGWLRKASDEGHVKAISESAHWLYELGNPELAIAVWVKIADRHPPAAYALGVAYHFGAKIKADPGQAIKYYRLAAESQHGVALNNLGDMYENGLGVERSYPEAITLYKRSALLETDIAFYSLASLYLEGKGVPKDVRLAYVYDALALRYGFKKAQVRRDELAKQLSDDARKEADAMAASWNASRPLPGLGAVSVSSASQE